MNVSTITNGTIVCQLEDGIEKTIRVYGTHADPHFSGKDICDILDIKDFKQAIQDMVSNDHKIELKKLFEQLNNDPIIPSWVGVLKPPTSLGSIDPKTISHNDGRLVVLSEPGVYDLLNGTRKDKNKKLLRDVINRAMYTIKYKDSAGLIDIFSFISKLDLAIDIGSNWFQDLWYPLSKSQGPLQGALNKVDNHL